MYHEGRNDYVLRGISLISPKLQRTDSQEEADIK